MNEPVPRSAPPRRGAIEYKSMSEELTDITCPRCGGQMEHGYIAGHWSRLRWVTRPDTKTIFAGTPLRKKLNW